MNMGWRALLGRVIVASTLLVLVVVHLPSAASAAVGGPLRTITPALAAQCGNQGGTSIAIVQGSKLIDSTVANGGALLLANPALLAITCLDSSNVTNRSTINFIKLSDPLSDPLGSGTVIKSITTKIGGVVAAPGNGWAHLVLRPDKGDLLGCGTDGTIYSIAFIWFNSPPTLPAGPPLGTAKQLPRPGNLSSSCGGLAWDPAEGMIYQGLSSASGKIDVARFKDGTSVLNGTVNTPGTCTPSGLAITGGVLVVACNDNAHTILRYDKNNIPPPSQNP